MALTNTLPTSAKMGRAAAPRDNPGGTGTREYRACLAR
jgi:hypothetical protein